MATSEVYAEVSEDGFTILTHVITSLSPPSGESPKESETGARCHIQGESKALGAVQIMVGILMYLFGYVSTPYFENISGYSEVHRWGSLIFIGSGAVSVTAAHQLHPYVIVYSVFMNVISAVASGAAILLLSFDMIWYMNYRTYQSELWGLSCGISGVLLVFSLLDFIISVCLSAVFCRASCCMLPLTSPSDFNGPAVFRNPDSAQGFSSHNPQIEIMDEDYV